MVKNWDGKEVFRMAFQTVFKRYELKYLLTLAQKERILAAMEPYMALDKYGRTTIRNLYFDNVHASARYFNHIQGREGTPIGKLVFSNCSFLKLAPEKLEIDANTVPNKFCQGGILYADDVVYNNTSFRSEV